MSEQYPHPAAVPSPANADIVALIKRMQQQLDFLERKIDTLISQSQERPFREKRFSKPFRSFDHSARPGDFSGRTGEKRQGDQSRSFNNAGIPKKKSFFHKRKDRG